MSCAQPASRLSRLCTLYATESPNLFAAALRVNHLSNAFVHLQAIHKSWSNTTLKIAFIRNDLTHFSKAFAHHRLTQQSWLETIPNIVPICDNV